MPSIALVNVYRKTEGITVAIRLYEDILARSGFQTHLYQCIEGPDADYLNDATVLHGLHLPIRYLEKGINRGVVFPILLRNLSQDLILLSDPWLLNLTKFKKNVVVLVHDLRLLTKYTENSAQSIMFKQVISRLHNVKKIISISKATRDSLVGMGIHESKIAVIPHCTNIEMDGRHHIEMSLLKIERGEPLNVVYVSSDMPYKRISMFLRIASTIANTNNAKNFRFTILSRLSERTLRMVKDEGLNNLSVVREVDDISEFYSQADILLYTSEFEGFGRPLLEAMASGIPIIARDIPIVREVVGEAALLVGSDDLNLWTNALTSILDATVYKEIALNVLSKSEEFSKQKFEVRVKELFSALTDSD